MPENKKFELTVSVRKGPNTEVVFLNEQVVGKEVHDYYSKFLASMLTNYVLSQLDDVLSKHPVNSVTLKINRTPLKLSTFPINRQKFSVELYRQIMLGLTQEADQ